jgi:hypothetical protein
MSAETKKAPPVQEIREGKVKIAIWRRQSEKGVFYVAGIPEVSYEKDGKWHDGNSFDDFDLECLSLAALEAKKAIRKLRKAAKTAAQSVNEDE